MKTYRPSSFLVEHGSSATQIVGSITPNKITNAIRVIDICSSRFELPERLYRPLGRLNVSSRSISDLGLCDKHIRSTPPDSRHCPGTHSGPFSANRVNSRGKSRQRKSRQKAALNSNPMIVY